MSLQNIIITASINSIATQSYGQRTYIPSSNEQSFPIEEATMTNVTSETFNTMATSLDELKSHQNERFLAVCFRCGATENPPQRSMDDLLRLRLH